MAKAEVFSHSGFTNLWQGRVMYSRPWRLQGRGTLRSMVSNIGLVSAASCCFQQCSAGRVVRSIIPFGQGFDLLDGGTLTHHHSGWPSKWTLESEDRAEFIEQIRWFSSNYAPQFGRLLTPIVDGIRVRGPLFPSFNKAAPKLVLLDGQGLGHTPDSSASVTTAITKRFADVDVILLVDSAQQPMQAAPLSVVRAVAASGHQQKLAIAFTHFDQVKGVNLPSFGDKRAHVMASVTNGLTNLRDVLGVPIVRAIERTIDDQCFMLGGLDQPSKRLPKGVVVELDRMLSFCAQAIEPPPEPQAHPVYNPDGLVLALQGASRSFRRPWTARLGLGPHESVHKEHWTRIKALNRRIAGELNNEYDTLRPVADLVARLIEEVSKFLDNPTAWEPRQPTEEEAEAAISEVRQQVYTGSTLWPSGVLWSSTWTSGAPPLTCVVRARRSTEHRRSTPSTSAARRLHQRS